MKKTIGILCAMLAASMMTLTPCLAADEMICFEQESSQTISPYYVGITNPFAIISRSESYIYGSVSASYYAGYTAKLSVTVQRSRDGMSWSKAGSLGTVNGGSGKVSLSDNYPTVSGYSYRLEATVTVYDGGSVVESLTFYSNIV